ncbi:MAG: M28 family peptidase, partial [Planctomycetia bacterium]|nr:M28 family peptidase [Planctomycetia bacterium]
LPVRPRRPILFAFWDGEEKGLLGSSHFVRVRPAALAALTPVFSVNLDMIGRLRGDRLEVYGARTATGLRSSIVQSNNRPGGQPLDLVFDWAIEEDSDHYPFITARIPTVMFHTGLHDQYHRPSDDVQLVNFDGIEPVARLTLDFVTALADAPEPPHAFRDQCRGETDATRRSLEMPAAGPAPTTAPPAGGMPPRPRWGIGTRSDPGEPTRPIVVRVGPGSAADRGGLQVGDRVVAVDGVDVASQADLIARLAAAGDAVAVDIDRKGRIIRVEMRTDTRTDGQADGTVNRGAE